MAKYAGEWAAGQELGDRSPQDAFRWTESTERLVQSNQEQEMCSLALLTYPFGAVHFPTQMSANICRV